MLFIVAALAPAIAIVLFIYRKDKYDREPFLVLLFSFLLGAVSIIPAGFSEAILENNYSEFPLLNIFINAFFIIGVIEEGVKFLILRYYAYRQEAFNEPLDGIVYALLIGMGFAGAENLLYVFDGGLEVAMMRMFTAIPAHATFAVIMGYYVGESYQKPNKYIYFAKGFGLAVIMHGFYDYCLMVNDILYIGLGAFISLGISLHFANKAVIKHENASLIQYVLRQKKMNAENNNESK